MSKELRRLHKEFKEFDGGVLKFKDQYTGKKLYIEMDYQDSLKIFKALKKKREFVVLMGLDKESRIFNTIEELKKSLDTYLDIKAGGIFNLNTKYCVCDESSIISLLQSMTCPEKDSSRNEKIRVNYHFDSPNVIKNNSFDTVKKKKSIFEYNRKTSSKRFDWDEEYLEGLRNFGTIDEAEAYADDQEIEYKKNLNTQ